MLRAVGAANLDVIQEVEYVKEEDKLAYLLDCLQKTAPPVLIFAENKRDVDAIHEFLLVQVGCTYVMAAEQHCCVCSMEHGGAECLPSFQHGNCTTYDKVCLSQQRLSYSTAPTVSCRVLML